MPGEADPAGQRGHRAYKVRDPRDPRHDGRGAQVDQHVHALAEHHRFVEGEAKPARERRSECLLHGDDSGSDTRREPGGSTGSAGLLFYFRWQ